MKIETNSFVRSHGKQPRGYGMWGFEVTHTDGREEIVFVPHSMAYTDAKRWIKANRAATVEFIATAP